MRVRPSLLSHPELSSFLGLCSFLGSAALLFVPTPAPPSVGWQEEAGPEAADTYVCPPCGADCHERTYAEPGHCATCGMELVPTASVPSVAVLLVEGVDLLTAAAPLGVFAKSDEVRVFTVADTRDPIRSREGLELLPAFDFDGAPAVDVLVLPSGGHGVWDDEYVMDWIERTAAGADHVLGIGTGALLAAKAGQTADLAIPVSQGYGEYLAKDFPELELVEGLGVTSNERVVLASDVAGALEAALRALERLSGAEAAARTAGRLGLEDPGSGR